MAAAETPGPSSSGSIEPLDEEDIAILASHHQSRPMQEFTSRLNERPHKLVIYFDANIGRNSKLQLHKTSTA